MNGVDLTITHGYGTTEEIFEGKKAVVLYPGRKQRSGKWRNRAEGLAPHCCVNATVGQHFFAYDGLHESVKITVSYFDAGQGSFTLLYDGMDHPESVAEVVDLHNTMRWLEYTFYLQNPRFGRRCGGYDFRVSVYSDSMGHSFAPVAIGKITLERAQCSCPIKIFPAKSDNPGNTFFNGDMIKLWSQMQNRTDAPLTLNLRCSLIDRDTFQTIWEDNSGLEFAPKQTLTVVTCPVTRQYGVYLLRMELYDAEGTVYCRKNTKLAVANCSDSVPANQTLGFSDHFAQGWKENPEIPLMLMRKGGFGINRDEILWQDYELKKDQFQVPDFEETYLNSAAKYGIEPCFTLGKNNPHIGVQHCPARTKEEQERWRLYVRNVVKDLKGRVRLYSIYNEANIEFKKTSSVHWYVEDLKIACEEIRAVDPEAKILGFTTANLPYYWLEEAFRQGALQYCDIIDVHPYCWDTAPEEFDFVERVKRVYALVKKYGGNHPVWNTEFGYPVMTKGCGIADENQQGINLMHTYLYCRAHQILDQFYIYQFADSNNRNRGDAEANFGVLYAVKPNLRETPYAAKPAYLMLANMNRLLAQATCLGEFFCHDRMTMIRFQRTDGTQVAVYWAYWNTTENYLTMDFGVDRITVYDKYGNSQAMTSKNGIYELPVTYDTVFVEGRFSKFEDLSEYPA